MIVLTVVHTATPSHRYNVTSSSPSSTIVTIITAHNARCCCNTSQSHPQRHTHDTVVLPTRHAHDTVVDHRCRPSHDTVAPSHRHPTASLTTPLHHQTRHTHDEGVGGGRGAIRFVTPMTVAPPDRHTVTPTTHLDHQTLAPATPLRYYIVPDRRTHAPSDHA